MAARLGRINLTNDRELIHSDTPGGIDNLAVMDNIDEFMERRGIELAGRTADLLRELAINLNIENIERELHRIAGTCGTYGLMDGSRGATDLLSRVRGEHVGGLASELNALADVFAKSSRVRES